MKEYVIRKKNKRKSKKCTPWKFYEIMVSSVLFS